MIEIAITKREENQRLDKFLLKYMNTAKKSFIYQMLRKKRIKLNKSKAEGNEMLKSGDVLQMYLSEETIFSFMSVKPLAKAERHFAIIYEDDHVLFVSKPAGLLSHPENDSQKDTLIDQVLYYLHEKGQYTPSKTNTFTPALCNRLDRNTSGMVLVGKTLKGVQGLNSILRERTIDKYYIALVSGEVTKEGEIKTYLSKDEEKNQAKISDKAFNLLSETSAFTKYKPLASVKDYSLVEVELFTGKTHQIRVHMQSINHEVIGDRKYGKEDINRIFKAEYGLNNQFLHGYKIVFHHGDNLPALHYLGGKTFVSPLPKSFSEIQNDLFGDLDLE